jgi:hypothetical protein
MEMSKCYRMIEPSPVGRQACLVLTRLADVK